MKLPKLFAIVVLTCLPTPRLLSQGTEAEINDVKLTEVAPQIVRLNWTAMQPSGCGDHITYAVFRGTTEDFDFAEENRIATGITATHFTAHEPKGPLSFYYRVTAIRVEGYCEPLNLKSGKILAYPLDFGGQYTVEVGAKSETCKASSTAEIVCDTLPNFHSVLASQSGHEFLIGCLSSDYEDNNWTCVNLTPGVYTVGVHSRTVTIWDAGFKKVNTKSGKELGSITPEFSVLSVVK